MKLFSHRIRRLNKFAELARFSSNKELRKIGHLFSGDVVNASGWKDEDQEGGCYRDYFTNAKSYTVTNYSGERALQNREGEIFLDLEQALPDSFRRRFDRVFSHTVLEHIFDFQQPFRNMAEMSRDVVIVVVPFCQCSHELSSYKDYWRFTPSALHAMYSREGVTVIYEASNQHVGSASYLFFVGSRRLDHYANKMPAWQPLGKQCAWIGRRRWVGPLRYLWIDDCNKMRAQKTRK